jgi:hypothetical protein
MASIRSFQDFYGTAHGHKKCLYWVLLKTYKKWQNLLKKANPFFLWDGSEPHQCISGVLRNREVLHLEYIWNI